MEVKASLQFIRVGAQKARLIANLVRKKGINEALKIVSFMPQKSAGLIKTLLESAVANAEDKKTIDVDNLYVKSITVDQAAFSKRFRTGSQGRSTMVKKKSSHIKVILEER